MISDEVKNSISKWAKKTDSNDATTLELLAIKYIEENQVEWNTPSGKAKVISYVEELSYGKTRQSVEFIDGWEGHQPDNKPFELSLDEENENDFSLPRVKKPSITSIKQKVEESNSKIGTLTFPFEIEELFRELDDKAYKSQYLANFTAQGRIKLIRKAKILAFLYETKK